MNLNKIILDLTTQLLVFEWNPFLFPNEWLPTNIFTTTNIVKDTSHGEDSCS